MPTNKIQRLQLQLPLHTLKRFGVYQNEFEFSIIFDYDLGNGFKHFLIHVNYMFVIVKNVRVIWCSFILVLL